MGRTTLTLLLGQDADWLKASLENLADDVVSDAEAGQRGTKLSVLVRMIASAGIANVREAARLLRAMKGLCEGAESPAESFRLRWSEPGGDVAAGDDWENAETLADYLEQTGRCDIAIVRDARGIAAIYASDHAMQAATDLFAADGSRDAARWNTLNHDEGGF